MSNIEKQLVPDEVRMYQKAYDKLDMYKVFNLVGFHPHKGQKEMIEAVIDPNTHFTTISAGRRGGKTYTLAAIACGRLLLPNASIALLAPTFSNASNLYKETFKFIKRTGVKITEQNRTNLSFTLENGSTFTAVSVKNIDSILGAKLSTIIVDEAAIMEQEFLEEAIDRNLTPALASYGVNENEVPYGEIILISSPRAAKGFFYNSFKKGKSGVKGYASIQLATSANPYIPKSFIEQKEKELPPEIFQTEYLGMFNNNSNNSVFYHFDYNRNTFDMNEIVDELNKDSTMLVGLDFGYTDNTSLVYIYIQPMTGIYYIINEYMQNKLSLGEHHVNFIKAETYAEPTFRFFDPSGVAIASSLMVDYNYDCSPAMNAIQPSLDLLNTLFYQGKIKINKECTKTIETVELLEYKDTTKKSNDPFKQNLPKRLGHADAISSLRYAIYTHYKIHVESDFGIQRL